MTMRNYFYFDGSGAGAGAGSGVGAGSGSGVGAGVGAGSSDAEAAPVICDVDGVASTAAIAMAANKTATSVERLATKIFFMSISS